VQASATNDSTAKSHKRTVLSALAEAKSLPSGLNATENTLMVWPVSGSPRGLPLATSHKRTVLSAPAEAKSLPLLAAAVRHDLMNLPRRSHLPLYCRKQLYSPKCLEKLFGNLG